VSACRKQHLDGPISLDLTLRSGQVFHWESLQMCRGLRILRQPRWECLATFITSSMKQVAHIRAMSKQYLFHRARVLAK
jgi:hypothetical protein